jgi:hypothetical protein
MKVRNLTGKDVRLVFPETKAAVTYHPWPRSKPARVVPGRSHVYGIPVFPVTVTVEGLPLPEEGVIFIVTSEVFATCDRPDVFTPGRPCDGGYLGLQQKEVTHA